MATPTLSRLTFPSSLFSQDAGSLTLDLSQAPTPLTQAGEPSPSIYEPSTPMSPTAPGQKKKKKKKSKKSKSKSDAMLNSPTVAPPVTPAVHERPQVLCISRNKHWRYISSYHGPWLQLPVELLETLLILNLDPNTLNLAENRQAIIQSAAVAGRQRDRGYQSLVENSPPESPRNGFSHLQTPTMFPTPQPGKITPPPIDPGVFRNVTLIRKLIDEAAELSVRATTGLSAAELNSMGGVIGSNWTTAQSLSSQLGNGGRTPTMSATRIYRLRALAVQKLAQAYKLDEVAASVMVMQGGTVFDDVAERVLKAEPNDIDAKYVHFFHEKIPSRQLAEWTTTALLDELIHTQPQRLEFYRTRGIVHSFRDEYPQAIKDYTHCLKEVRTLRRARSQHRQTTPQDSRGKGKRKKNGTTANARGDQSGSEHTAEVEGKLHPSASAEAPDPLEPQLLFLRGTAYLQHAIFLIESAILDLEGINKSMYADGSDLRLCQLEGGRYGGVEVSNPDGPLGESEGVKLSAYRGRLATIELREQVFSLLRKSIRDHERFLAHFDTIEAPNALPDLDLASLVEHAFNLTEAIRPGNTPPITTHSGEPPVIYTTYHPLMVESHFNILLCTLMLAEMSTLLSTFVRSAAVVDALEGYPVFLPPRSMAQAEFVEVLERLAACWESGIQPHSLSSATAKGKAPSDAPLALLSPLNPISAAPAPSSEKEKEVDRAAICSQSITDESGDTAQPSSSRFKFTDNDDESPIHSPTSSSDNPHLRLDAPEALDYMRMLLAPVYKRQRERAEKMSAEKSSRHVPINIPLHGPRVEVILAWFAAVHIPEIDVDARS